MWLYCYSANLGVSCRYLHARYTYRVSYVSMFSQYTCTIRHSQSTTRHALNKIRSGLQKCKTDSILIKAFTTILHQFHKGEQYKCPEILIGGETQECILQQVYKKQTKFGGEALAQGILVCNWTLLQNICNIKKQLEERSLGWIKCVIYCLWKYSNHI